ncbi:MAG: CRISPR-associated helicase Cas3' [bacterium]
MDKYIAHTENEMGEYHTLEDHLKGTAEKAKRFAAKWGASDLAYVLGQIHDLGKYSQGFQNYLLKDGNSVEHSISGAVYLKEKTKINFKEILAFIVAGHHGGLHNKGDLVNKLEKKKKFDFVQEGISKYEEKFEGIFKENFEVDINIRNQYEVEFFIRMLFSSLVDADFLDTEKHFDQSKYSLRELEQYDLKELWTKFKRDQDELQQNAEDTFVNRIRKNIYKKSIKKADNKNGFYSMTVPTGGGKTRTGLGFALKHAIHNNMDRVIVVIPYTNIIEQTAKEYKEILGYNKVLEHHSNFEFTEDDKEMESRVKLAAENWDMPIVVTTSVQFFESIFASKVSRTRKIHNIANSVIIMDEVQTLPPGFLKAILQVMKQLVNNYSSTIIFSTATQPAFKTRAGFEGIDNIKEIAPQPDKIYKDLKRVEYNFDYIEQKMSWREVVEKMLEKKQALVVLNTRDGAREVFSKLKQSEQNNIYHLSTYMCAKHRSIVLDEIKEKLKNNENCYLVSTQLIEAGVDIDFPLVLRAIAPLDSIVQAAGRCNREGELDVGEVIVFEPEEAKLPSGIYKTATGKTKLFLDDPKKLQDPDIFYDYFNTLYSDVNLDKSNIQELRESFSFREVDYKFKLIPDDTVNVIIENFRLVDKLPVDLNLIKKKEFISRDEWRKLQPFIVSLRKYKVNDLLKEGLINELIEDVYVWTGKYDKNEGIKKEYTPGDLTT